jgi:hypothetical protein
MFSLTVEAESSADFAVSQDFILQVVGKALRNQIVLSQENPKLDTRNLKEFRKPKLENRKSLTADCTDVFSDGRS